MFLFLVHREGNKINTSLLYLILVSFCFVFIFILFHFSLYVCFYRLRKFFSSDIINSEVCEYKTLEHTFGETCALAMFAFSSIQ